MFSKKRLVIVDDEKRLADIIGKFLEKQGFIVKVFYDPREVLVYLRENTVDLVISDLQMPWMNGLQLAHDLGDIMPSAEVIIYSAHATQTTKARADDLGVFSVLDKPVHLPELLEWVKKGLESNRAWRTRNGSHPLPQAPKILIIDDYVPLLEVFSEYFYSKGFQVHTATRGAEGIKKGLLENYRFVIVDIGLPDISGVEVIKSLHESAPLLPIYAFTGEATDEEIQEVKKIGARRAFSKPLTPNDLAEAIDHAEHEFQEIQRRNEISERHRHRWQTLPWTSKLRLYWKSFWHKRKKISIAILLSLAIIAVSIWFLIIFQQRQIQYQDEKYRQTKSELDKVLELLERGEGYLKRDELRERLKEK